MNVISSEAISAIIIIGGHIVCWQGIVRILDLCNRLDKGTLLSSQRLVAYIITTNDWLLNGAVA